MQSIGFQSYEKAKEMDCHYNSLWTVRKELVVLILPNNLFTQTYFFGKLGKNHSV